MDLEERLSSGSRPPKSQEESSNLEGARESSAGFSPQARRHHWASSASGRAPHTPRTKHQTPRHTASDWTLVPGPADPDTHSPGSLPSPSDTQAGLQRALEPFQRIHNECVSPL